MDGTLLDTLEDIGNSVNRVLVKRGFPSHAIDKYREFIGDGPRLLIFRALPQDSRNEQLVEACLADYVDDYRKNCDQNTRLYAGIAELLDELVRRNFKLAILSNKEHELTKLCVDLFLSGWRFDVILGLRPNVPRKPDPAGALEIAEFISFSADEFIYVGDSVTDMKTAAAAGMFSVAAGWGFGSPEKLKASGAGMLIQHPMELLNRLDDPSDD